MPSTFLLRCIAVGPRGTPLSAKLPSMSKYSHISLPLHLLTSNNLPTLQASSTLAMDLGGYDSFPQPSPVFQSSTIDPFNYELSTVLRLLNVLSSLFPLLYQQAQVTSHTDRRYQRMEHPPHLLAVVRVRAAPVIRQELDWGRADDRFPVLQGHNECGKCKVRYDGEEVGSRMGEGGC